ncbi:MAG: S8 family serine peptidase, partial [Trichodesmium sp.]
MVLSWKKTAKSKQKLKQNAKEQQKKRRSQTFVLEEIISPSVPFCPIPIDDSLGHIPGLELFTQEELVAAILGNNSVVDINNIDAESLFEDYFAKIDEYLTENPTEADAFDVDNLSTWPTLEALINPGQPTVEIPDVGGAVGTLPPPVTVPIDPPRNNYNKDYDFPLENQPLVGIIDTGFSGNNPDIDYSRITLGSDRLDNDNNPLLNSGEGSEHGTHVLGIIGATRDNGLGIDGINDNAPLWLGRTIGSGEWAESLREFVDNFRESGKKNGIANLSLDLTQTDKNGITTTRYELTPEERVALEYARQNGVLIVTAAGNDGGVMSVLGQASQEFDNIITVGAADGENRAAYSSYGNGLDILAPGGTESNPLLSTVGDGLGKMAGTSVATAQVSGAASLVWAANPDLNYSQVKEILKSTAQ